MLSLMRSIEGKVGEPRAKYVRSAERGLDDCPTVLNNVETWANLGAIMVHGGAWLAALGRKTLRLVDSWEPPRNTDYQAAAGESRQSPPRTSPGHPPRLVVNPDRRSRVYGDR